jgi:hypothetical protein
MDQLLSMPLVVGLRRQIEPDRGYAQDQDAGHSCDDKVTKHRCTMSMEAPHATLNI